MENILNVTWEDKAALYAVEDFDDYAYRGYLKGASDFQKRTQEFLENYLNYLEDPNERHMLKDIYKKIQTLEAHE